MGIRECFVPRPGYVFAQADYSGLELCTLAQVCIDLFGYSKLADVINSGRDPHTALAASLGGLTYEDGEAARKTKDKHFDDLRKVAKAANFGLPGGLGAKKFVDFAAKGGVKLTVEEAKQRKRDWLAQWEEMHEYFDYIDSLQRADGSIVLTQVRSKRIRTCRPPNAYTSACNSLFQGLGADAASHATWVVARACYAEPDSPLFGSRLVNMVHDELILETPDTPNAHDAAVELERLMVSAAQEWMPNIRMAAPPLLMREWSKNAVAVYDTHGRMTPWSGQVTVQAA